MNSYEQKRQEKHDRLLAAAEKARKESDSLYNTYQKMSDVIPFGQPILVGHHSERGDRNYRARIDNTMRKSIEMDNKADYYEQRAKSIENNHAIFSDDPEATTKLADRIAKLEQRQELMKAANKLVKKNDREGLSELGFDDKVIDSLFKPDCFGNLGFASYAITNNGANIRRLKQRLTYLEKLSELETTEKTINDVTIIANTEANRVQIKFPDKPAEEVRKELKANGFRWAPSEGAWQRHYNNWALKLAQDIVKKYY